MFKKTLHQFPSKDGAPVASADGPDGPNSRAITFLAIHCSRNKNLWMVLTTKFL